MNRASRREQKKARLLKIGRDEEFREKKTPAKTGEQHTLLSAQEKRK